MSTPCDKEGCILRLERIAATAKILASQMRSRDWYQNVQPNARQIVADATFVCGEIDNDTGWAASDR